MRENNSKLNNWQSINFQNTQAAHTTQYQKTKQPNKKVKVKSLSHVRLFATPWTVAYQGPLSMGFSRQEHWSGLPFPSPGDLPNPGIEPGSPSLRVDALPSEPPVKPQMEEGKSMHSGPGLYSFYHWVG